MNFIVLSPSGDGPTGDRPLKESKSDITHSHFGGNREVSEDISSGKDYTQRATEKITSKKENPVDETVRDIDEMTEAESRKREFSRREETSNVQKNNEADWQTKSDADNRPRVDEGSDAVQVPEVVEERVRRKANRWQYGSSNTYEGELS